MSDSDSARQSLLAAGGDHTQPESIAELDREIARTKKKAWLNTLVICSHGWVAASLLIVHTLIGLLMVGLLFVLEYALQLVKFEGSYVPFSTTITYGAVSHSMKLLLLFLFLVKGTWDSFVYLIMRRI